MSEQKTNDNTNTEKIGEATKGSSAMSTSDGISGLSADDGPASIEDMTQRDIIIEVSQDTVILDLDGMEGRENPVEDADSTDREDADSQDSDSQTDCVETIDDMDDTSVNTESVASPEEVQGCSVTEQNPVISASDPIVDAEDSSASGTKGPLHGAPKKHRGAKRLAVCLGVFVGIVACAYFVGAFVFSNHYLPNTYIAGIDASMKTPDEVASELANEVSAYGLEVSGQGIDMSLSAEDVGLGIDAKAAADGLMAMQNPWEWPIEALETRDGEDLFAKSLSFGALSDTVSKTVVAFNESATQPVNATAAYNPETGLFEVVEEVPGTAVNVDMVEDMITESVSGLDDFLGLDESILIAPTVFSTDSDLISAVDEANRIADTALSFTLDEAEVAALSKDTVVPWIAISEENEVSVDEAAINDWVAKVASKCNSSGQTHTYQRADGKTVTVSGGTYGRRIDSDALVLDVLESVKAGEHKTIAIPLSRNVADGTGRNWGRYVDVDISEQHARFYDENDNLLWETDIVTGANGKHDTPTGVYTLNSKSTGVTLRGPMKDGKYEWESYVDYWMPFVGSSVGLHDATWQSAFGGTRFMDGFGSHGCVNLPRGAAASLYGIIQVGDVVVVHY